MREISRHAHATLLKVAMIQLCKQGGGGVGGGRREGGREGATGAIVTRKI